MTPCTAKDVQELNARLLRQFVDECAARLRDELRAQLSSASIAHNGNALLSGNGQLSNSSLHVSSEFPRHVSLREGIPVLPPPDSSIVTLSPAVDSGVWNNHGQLPNLGAWKLEAQEEWTGDSWTDADETQWLLSKPFGPLDIPQEGVRNSSGLTSSMSVFGFVQSTWFQAVSACVIMLNTLMILIESHDPAMKSDCFWPGQLMLSFYVIELFSRICYFGKSYLQGPRSFLAWNVFDCVVVFAGVFSQWILPFFPQLKGGIIGSGLQVLRSLRILRVLRVVRVLFESDLSWTDEPRFQSFIGAVIAFNSLLMGFETDFHWHGFFYIEQVLLVIYVFELSVRLRRFGCDFLMCSNPDFNWNILDLIIVTSSVLDSWVLPAMFRLIDVFMGGDSHEDSGTPKKSGMRLGQVMMLMRMLRLMRILRLAKLIKSIRKLYILVTSITAAFQGVSWVLLFTLVVLYALGIFATRLIGHRMIFPDGIYVDNSAIEPFETVSISMFTLFRLMSGSASDGESSAVDAVMAVVPWFKFAFVFFMITSSWTLLSILTAVVSEVMISTTQEQEYELKLATEEENTEALVRSLRDLFEKIDTDRTGTIAMSELLDYLHQKEHKVEVAKMCHVPVRDLIKVFKSMDDENGQITFKHFTDCMTTVGAPVTEKSIMRLEWRILEVERLVSLLLGDHPRCTIVS